MRSVSLQMHSLAGIATLALVSMQLIAIQAEAQCPAVACQASESGTAYTSNGSLHRCADDFAFESPATILSICWRGVRMHFGPPAADCADSSLDEFVIRFLADNGSCVPGDVLAEFSQVDGSLAAVTRQPTGEFIGDVACQEWSASITGGFVADISARYWLEITCADSPRDCTFLWMRSGDGNGSFVQDSLGVYDTTDRRTVGDLSFCLFTAKSQPFIAPDVTCLPTCPNADHDCLSEGSPGCVDDACCAAMCDFDVYCCSHTWDTLCVSQAMDVCSLCDDGSGDLAFNIDFGADARSPRPSSSFGAASGQFGFWNVVPAADGEAMPLCNLTGVDTEVTIEIAGSHGGYHSDHPLTTGNIERLLDDLMDLGGLSVSTVSISNLAAGSYAVYTYAWAPDDSTFLTSVDLNAGGAQSIGGEWTGDFTAGTTHAFHTVNTSDGSITLQISASRGLASLNALQIVPMKEVEPCPADIAPAAAGDCLADGDGSVSAADLAELLANWGSRPANACADVAPVASQGDGVVGPADLAELLANWGDCR